MRSTAFKRASGSAIVFNEWQEAYSRLREHLPSKPRLSLLKFDAINNRVVYSRQELQRVWIADFE